MLHTMCYVSLFHIVIHVLRKNLKKSVRADGRAHDVTKKYHQLYALNQTLVFEAVPLKLHTITYVQNYP